MIKLPTVRLAARSALRNLNRGIILLRLVPLLLLRPLTLVICLVSNLVSVVSLNLTPARHRYPAERRRISALSISYRWTQPAASLQCPPLRAHRLEQVQLLLASTLLLLSTRRKVFCLNLLSVSFLFTLRSFMLL